MTSCLLVFFIQIPDLLKPVEAFVAVLLGLHKSLMLHTHIREGQLRLHTHPKFFWALWNIWTTKAAYWTKTWTKQLISLWRQKILVIYVAVDERSSSGIGKKMNHEEGKKMQQHTARSRRLRHETRSRLQNMKREMKDARGKISKPG